MPKISQELADRITAWELGVLERDVDLVNRLKRELAPPTVTIEGNVWAKGPGDAWRMGTLAVESYTNLSMALDALYEARQRIAALEAEAGS